MVSGERLMCWMYLLSSGSIYHSKSKWRMSQKPANNKPLQHGWCQGWVYCAETPPPLCFIIVFNPCNYRSASYWNTSDSYCVFTLAVIIIFFLPHVTLVALGWVFLSWVSACCHGIVCLAWQVQCNDINYLVTYWTLSAVVLLKNSGWKCLCINCISLLVYYCLLVSDLTGKVCSLWLWVSVCSKSTMLYFRNIQHSHHHPSQTLVVNFLYSYSFM